MVESSSNADDKKLKLKTPTPFSGKREDLRKFLQEVKLYLLGNRKHYTDDDDKVLFVLSYMTEGDANSWKEEFVETAEQTATQDNAVFSLGTYDNLIKKITEAFSPFDAPKDAIYEMREMNMGNTPIEEHIAKFKMLVTQSKLAKNDAVIEYFRETLPVSLQKNILSLPEPPTKLDDWYKIAIRSHNNWLRMRSAIAKTQNRGSKSAAPQKKTQEPRRFYFEPRQKDPNAMDIDYMSTEERTTLMRKGACFKCKETGHLARDCKKGQNTTPQKMRGKELAAHVRTLMAQMEDKEKEDFYDDASKAGF